MTRTNRLVLWLLLGFGLLAGAAWALVHRAHGQAVAEALEEQGMEHEEHLLVIIRALEPLCNTLPEMGRQLTAIAREHPALLDLLVLDENKAVVSRYTREGNAMPCVAAAPLGRALHHVHDHGQEASVACRSLPVSVGPSKGMILFHAKRDWRMGGARVGGWVNRTALRMAPVYLLSYVLMGLMLVLASRRAQRWRARADSHARVEALGAIASGIDHEIKNPLNTVGLSLQYLRRKHKDAETREVVDSAEREARRISETLQTFVRFTRVSDLSVGAADIAACVKKVAAAQDARMKVDGTAKAAIDGDKMHEAIGDMVAVFGGTKAPIRVRLAESGQSWRLDMQGPQPRFPADRLFDPYLRTKPRDIGHGLALARAIFQAHGGDLVAQTRGGQLTLKGTALMRPQGSSHE